MNYFYVFVLGILSILGPCTFIMVPVILNKIKESISQVVYFFSGILLVFVLLGIMASVTGIVFTSSISRYLYFAAGIVTFISALKMLGAVKIDYPHLEERKKTPRSFFAGILHGGVILGCIGPQLAATLSFIIAQRNLVNGILMTLFFGMGFILPFFIFGILITDPSVQTGIMKHANIIQKVGGALLTGAASYLLYFSVQGLI
ncbi:hypothetical protein A3A46_03370 [Candidatus Roizmanbacteria bacterium RIFCSPLOWO2_01_FULL_37_13]|uniref:Cytochrome C biogenesis protein transmembrane domain-containing protein n=1 Tax=Candidatus Roizmanbacteria bacterium RIFCSPHIGHO2_02_FULL_38_11 TaxID=1802039 RepID=A0A1F7GY21_9BACT|nr:MAG: hypothetical protein A3C25_02205 [Candidatus Roizmanbacteria bacterium RIFCSPHIGHO2_02_FULL_38_11]OGK33684.1 MAG: hypothetical protein A3F58_02290 [Candidatus Roizmanbacteria bacterium RIFCSPHIGHO2_12_FULL_37_9b]OGK43167.1 MAG: hypothetical protein A3A46_03370 [Candidatus Roizmanbacteria bacterium RIFCSPLOWO2_01_FULL_37_13]